MIKRTEWTNENKMKANEITGKGEKTEMKKEHKFEGKCQQLEDIEEEK